MEKKKDYERAKLELVSFLEVDIITSSNQLGNSDFDHSGWTKSTNKWN